MEWIRITAVALLSSFVEYSSWNLCFYLYADDTQLYVPLKPGSSDVSHILTGLKRSDHITPTLAALHWLPVSFRIDFKILLLVFKVLNGQAPAYISDLLLPYKPKRCLRSAGTALLSVPRFRLITKGGRAVADRAPQLWNSLFCDLRQASSVASFKSLLKTHFYHLAFS